MTKGVRLIVIFAFSGLFLFLDQFLKWQSLHAWREPQLLSRFFGWQPFLNPGIGFGLPVPGPIIIVLSIIILSLISYHLFKQINSGDKTRLSFIVYPLSFIIAGAVSNLIDRLVYGHAVDYIFAFTGYFNLADILIVAGFVVYLLQIQKSKVKNQN